MDTMKPEQEKPELKEDFEKVDDVTSNNNDGHYNRNVHKVEDLSKGDGIELDKDNISIFQQGLRQEKNGNLDAALQNYVKCLQGLKSHFFLLPYCLHKISDIHHNNGDYEQALHFAQAEKLCYETSPFITDEIHCFLDNITEDICGPTKDLNDLNIEALKAQEFESMAKDLAKNKQIKQAMEYAGKCTKIRQQIFGNSHEKTKSALHFFTSLFIDDKIQQYIESKRLHITIPQPLELSTAVPKSPEIIMSSPAGCEPVSILRQRSEVGLKDLVREKKQVHFHSSVDESLRKKEREKLISFTVSVTLMTILTALLASSGVWLFCYLDESNTCQLVMSQLYHWSHSLQQYFFVFTSAAPKSLS